MRKIEGIKTLEQFTKEMQSKSKEEIIEMLYRQSLKIIKIENKLEETITIIEREENI